MANFQRRVTSQNPFATNKNQLWPVPRSIGDATMRLVDLVGESEVNAIAEIGKIEFHAVGDTGVGIDSHQPEVAEAMARDLDTGAPQNTPVFFLNLGDIIYGPNKRSLYPNRFYRPNLPYLNPAPGFEGVILGIPGNHDGEVRDPSDNPSLNGFWENFVSPPGTNPPMAESFGVTMPHQPGAYWRLEAPFIDLIGLYSNAAEDFGILSKDDTDNYQQTWLAEALKEIAATRLGGQRKALVLAMHHPPYAKGLQEGEGGSGPGVSGHGGSPEMQKQLDIACESAGIWPDAVLSGHSHSYQRYKRQCRLADGHAFDTVYLVAGTGGIKSQPAPTGIGATKIDEEAPGLAGTRVVYGNGLESYGYLRVAATAAHLAITFVRTDRSHRSEFETVIVDLATQQQTAP